MGTIVGNLIKKYRKEKVIPQKVLCDGICTVSTLSRIENGIYMPSLMQIEVFFSRLGKAVPYNLVPVTFRERKIYNIKTAISEGKILPVIRKRLLAQYNYSILELFEKYQDIENDENKLKKQISMLIIISTVA